MRLLVNAGPTREFLDSVRFLSNASSGRMGYAVAEAARDAGHQVTLVSGPTALPDPDGVRTIHVVTGREMLEACEKEFSQNAAAVLAAAVCDYRPAARENRKIKKEAQEELVLRLVPTPDIAARLGAAKGRRVVVGFALEDQNAHAHAASKLRDKHLDAIVLNSPANIERDAGTIEILTADGAWSKPFTGTKTELSRHIMRAVEHLVSAGPPDSP